jgi:transposase-like protein
MSKETQVQDNPTNRKKGDHFDKAKIQEIVRAVERGATRSELIKRYGMAKSTLADWVREYGSPVYHASQRLLSASERRSLFRSVEEGGMTLHEAKLAYQLRSTVIVKRYLKMAEKEHIELRKVSLLMAKNEVRSAAILSDDVEALKKALQDAELQVKALNTLIDVAEETLKIDIRKKPGARQS